MEKLTLLKRSKPGGGFIAILIVDFLIGILFSLVAAILIPDLEKSPSFVVYLILCAALGILGFVGAINGLVYAISASRVKAELFYYDAEKKELIYVNWRGKEGRVPLNDFLELRRNMLTDWRVYLYFNDAGRKKKAVLGWTNDFLTGYNQVMELRK